MSSLFPLPAIETGLFFYMWGCGKASLRKEPWLHISCYSALLVWFLVHQLLQLCHLAVASRMETVFQAHSWVLTSGFNGLSVKTIWGGSYVNTRLVGRWSKADCMWFTGTGKFLVIPDTAGPGNNMESIMSWQWNAEIPVIQLDSRYE